MDGLTARVLDTESSTSLSTTARRRRWEKFAESFPAIAEMTVLDLGGRPEYWSNAPVQPRHVTVVNLDQHESSAAVTSLVGNACSPPPEVMSRNYDLVVSNSLIEHVGGHQQRAALAEVVAAAAPRHWIQTPYRYFPIEPHWMAPGMQFLPFAARVQMSRRWPLGHRRGNGSYDQAVGLVSEVDLIGLAQMRAYFPHSLIWKERMGGLIKSLVAVKV